MARARQARRRRGKKASSGTNWKKIAIFSCLGVFLLCAIGALVVYMWVKSYIRSDDFRGSVELRAGAALKGEGDLSQLHWNGSALYTDFFGADGYEDAWYSGFLAEGIRVNFDFGKSLRSQVWEITKVTVDRVTIDVSDERLIGVHPGLPESPKGFLSSWIPEGVEVGDCQVERFNFHFEDGRQIHLDDARIKVGKDVLGNLELTGDGGTLGVAGLPGFRVNDFIAKVTDGALVIDKMELDFYSEAKLGGKGEFKFGTNDSPGSVRADYRVTNLDLKDMVGDDWAKKVSGKLRGKFSVSGEKGNLLHRGNVELASGVLEALPVLESIAKYTGMDGFRKLALDKAELEYRYSGDTVNLTKVDLTSRDLLRVEGRADIKGGQIDGKFFVGVTPATLKWLPGAHKRVFTLERPEPENVGYAWTTMNVKGPLTAPRDDLSARLLEAAGLAILDAPGEAVKTITGGESELINGGVEAGSGLIESGVDTLKGFLPMFGP